MGTSNWDKFKLLLWKNWKINWNHKLALLFELLLPILFCLIILLIRTLANPAPFPQPTIFPRFLIDLDELSISMNPNSVSPIKKWELAYSPKNNILENLMTAANTKLKINLPVMGLENAKKLEEYMQNLNEQSIAAIQFDDSLSTITKLPDSITYTIRFPSELRTYTLTEYWYTNRLHPKYEFLAPREYYYDGGDPGYLREGFLPIQHEIAIAFIEQLAAANGITVTLPTFNMERTPFPPFFKDDLSQLVEVFIPMILVICFIHQAAQIVKRVSTEKEKQLKEVMRIMGIPNWIHWLAWFVMSFILMATSIIVIVLILKFKLSNAAILPQSDITLLLIVFFAYSFTAITFCFLLSTIFNKASTATAVTCLVWFIIYMPYQATIRNYNELNYSTKIILLFFFNTALAYAITLILRFEAKGEGLQWNNLFTPNNYRDNLTVGTIIIIMLLTALVHMLLALYFEKIFAGTYGVSEKWYFFLTKEYWLRNRKTNNKRAESSIQFSRRSAIETVSQDKNVGVAIIDLTKVFKDRTVVNKLNFNLYENEITVLLGHNGAGKTTTVSMLTGMIPPTSGTALINGYDITKDLENARSSLGLCPQYNILFDELTVREHIIFYSKLKGLKEKEVDYEIKKYLKILQMEDKMNTKSKNLSGGMKRKLSVVAALFGGTKVVILDEPSSGMDPAARRTLWDLLQLEKKDRTILLSTHFMDEADVLGDRIAIMSAGELQCYGTSFFLKKKYGTGYHLICVKGENCDPNEVTLLLKKYIPNIEIDKDIGSELSYQLPDTYVKQFPQMFADLEKNLEVLHLNGYGVSIPTLDEVFMLLGAEQNEVDERFNRKFIHACKIPKTGSDKNGSFLFSQWKAMLLKKYLSTKRNYYIALIQLFLVLYFAIVTGVILTSGKLNDWPPLLITLKDYPSVDAILSRPVEPFNQQADIVNAYEKYIKSFGSKYTTTKTNRKFVDYYLDIDPIFYTAKYLFGAEFGAEYICVYFNNELYHLLPLGFNVMHNAILRTYFPDDKHNIEVINYPLPRLLISKIEATNDATEGAGFKLAMNLSICMAFVTAFYVIFLIKERESRARLLQYVSGVRIYIFWLSHLIYDFFIFIILAIIVVMIISAFQIDGYKTYEELSILFLLLILFGLASISFMYVLSGFFEEAVSGFAYLAILNILAGATFLLVYVLPLINMKDAADISTSILAIFPNFALSDSLNNLYILSVIKESCLGFCKYIPQISECSLTELCKFNETCCVPSFYSITRPGIGLNMIYMIFVFLLCIIGILMFSYADKVLNKYKNKKVRNMRNQQQIFDDDSIDDDVKTEYLRIHKMTKEEIKQANLVLIDVTKYYDKFLAVNQVSFSVQRSECFGLLGVNGAGKTTLFKMMTGDLPMTSGNAYINGHSIRNEIQLIYRDIGYCPQFDALLEDLTGREIIHIFGLLRGIPEKYIHDIANLFAYGFGYLEHLDKPCKTYSGGNKRKLSTTIAMLGCPSVIYLDEPTSGMDPGARRQLWNMVDLMRSHDKIIVLTSHSMEECEALCTRLAIMVNGQFKCIGSTQHLKNKFSKGLIIKLKAKKSEPPNTYMVNSDRIKDFMIKEFPDAILREQYQEMLTYNIPQSKVKWSKIFGTLENNKDQLQIEDYTISQTTLEDVFLGFTSYQKEEKRMSKS